MLLAGFNENFAFVGKVNQRQILSGKYTTLYAHRDGLLSFLGGTCFASIAFGYPQRIFGVNPNPPQSKNVAIFSIIAAFHRQAGKLHGILNLQRFSAQHLYN